MDEDEKKKLKSLLQEKGKGNSGKLDWMYKEEKPDEEDYLLGKRIDKAVEKQDNSKEDDVGALFNERIQANIAMDMQTKMREDPLFAIRKKEEEAKRKLLQNPVKMKRLQEMLDQKKEKRKHKKSKRKHTSSNSDSDNDIMAKYLNILNRKQKSGKEGQQKSHDKHQIERERDSSPSSMEKAGKHQSRIGDRIKQHESDSDLENYQQKEEKNYRDREKKEGRNEDWRRREGRREFEREHERYKQSRDMDTGRMKRYADSEQGHRHSNEHFHGNRKFDSSRRKWDSDSENDSDNKNSKTSKHRNKELLESERTSYHRNKEKEQDRKQNYSDSEDRDHYSNRKDNRAAKNRHFDADEERKEKKVDKRNLEYRDSGKETGKKQRHSYSDDDHHSNKRVKNESPQSSSKSEEDSESDERQQKNKTSGFGLVMPRGVSPVRRLEKNRSLDRSRSSKVSGARSPKRRKSNSPPSKRTKSPHRQSQSTLPRNKSSGSHVLSEEEKQRRLEEMMDNAKWREDQRKQNVTRYREAEKKEEEEQKTNFDSSQFLNPMISGHVENSSVEDRLKRNKYNILRTNADLDRGFSKT